MHVILRIKLKSRLNHFHVQLSHLLNELQTVSEEDEEEKNVYVRNNKKRKELNE